MALDYSNPLTEEERKRRTKALFPKKEKTAKRTTINQSSPKVKKKIQLLKPPVSKVDQLGNQATNSIKGTASKLYNDADNYYSNGQAKRDLNSVVAGATPIYKEAKRGAQLLGGSLASIGSAALDILNAPFKGTGADPSLNAGTGKAPDVNTYGTGNNQMAVSSLFEPAIVKQNKETDKAVTAKKQVAEPKKEKEYVYNPVDDELAKRLGLTRMEEAGITGPQRRMYTNLDTAGFNRAMGNNQNGNYVKSGNQSIYPETMERRVKVPMGDGMFANVPISSAIKMAELNRQVLPQDSRAVDANGNSLGFGVNRNRMKTNADQRKLGSNSNGEALAQYVNGLRNRSLADVQSKRNYQDTANATKYNHEDKLASVKAQDAALLQKLKAQRDAHANGAKQLSASIMDQLTTEDIDQETGAKIKTFDTKTGSVVANLKQATNGKVSETLLLDVARENNELAAKGIKPAHSSHIAALLNDPTPENIANFRATYHYVPRILNR